MRINSVLIAGAGAIGLLVAETIYRADPACVSILAKGARLERYRKNGLAVNGERLDFKFGSEKPVDLIIIASKFHHLNQIIEDIKPYVGKDTIILSLLNGISSEDIIGKIYGSSRLPLAMIIGTDALHQHEETTYTQKGIINFGDAEGNNGEREKNVADFFARAKVPFALQPNMKRMLWYKYMINVGANQTTAVLRLPYAAVQNNGNPHQVNEACQLVEKAMSEVIAIANAQGIDLNKTDIANWYKTVNTLNPASYTSMCQDVLAYRKTEVEMFGFTMMELGKKLNIPVPVNEMLYLQIRTIEQTYRREK
ncbi:ketopantoate reductase family protein [Leadbettera azotonutricia]|uniref:2-dehydropantoate 2-reductase n=1 Tax=Leadbettera azotonutricia (strain ATCC BAA-888 / DSM 13862 / ZAS-9) TaxID=545695 RepID=F5YCH7_LEAAZ|nr:ketopantoate reductase family protein [Leadbettera azotonutricia]AEF81842.1 2-dehydropantoate 2-reductase [Leadbettera azotonutricia ZAS-9]